MDMYTFSEIIHINADFVLITKEAYLSRGVQAGTGMNVGLPQSHVSGLLISVSPIFPTQMPQKLGSLPPMGTATTALPRPPQFPV
jgi:hypothetical protein